MSRTLRHVLPIAMLLFVLLWASTAVAQPAEWQRIDVTLHSEQSGGVMLVSGELPESVKLPAEAELSVPAGSSLQWIGEILGGDPSADPPLTYTKSTVDGSDIYRFTLTQSHTAQIEILTSEPVGFDGTNYTSRIVWSATQAVPEVRLSVRIPQGAQIVQSSPDAVLQPGPSGYSFYTKSVKDVSPGDPLEMAFSYQVAVTPASTTAAASSGSAATVVIALIAVAAGGFFVMAVRRRIAPSSGNAAAPERTSASSVKSNTATSAKTGGKNTRSKNTTTGVSIEARAADGPSTRSTGIFRRNILTAAIVGSIVVVALVVGNETTKPQIEGDSITQTFSQGQPCSTATIALAVPASEDPATTAETLFNALRAADGMNTATYNFKTSTLEAGFCESKATEESVRQALAPTGLVDASAPAQSAAPDPTENAAATPSGEGQVLTVDTSSGSFAPSQLSAEAGTPIEIVFGQGTGCLSEVVFPELNIRQSLEGGPATVKLPALESGTYAFICGMDMQRGTLVVQ